jgi:hypothetical protein
MTGDFVPFEADLVIIESATKAESEDLEGVLYDMSNVKGFDTVLAETYTFIDALSNLLPATLKYSFLTVPMELKQREYIDKIFADEGVRVKTTSDLEEAIDWLHPMREYSKNVRTG